jgi:Family of unknown function (DUF5681)
MSRSNKKDYEVGYKKPPAKTRYIKGRTGNPNGRPKKIDPKLDVGELLQSLDNEEIVVVIDGRRKRMRRAEYDFREMFAKAIKGDLKAVRMIAKMVGNYLGPEPTGDSETEFVVAPDDAPSELNADQRSQISTGTLDFSNTRRSKEGRAGKSNGRRNKKILSIHCLFQKVAKEKTAIEIEGVQVRVSNMEACLRRLRLLASTNDSAQKLLNQLRKQFPGAPASGDTITFVISEDDSRL